MVDVVPRIHNKACCCKPGVLNILVADVAKEGACLVKHDELWTGLGSDRIWEGMVDQAKDLTLSL